MRTWMASTFLLWLWTGRGVLGETLPGMRVYPGLEIASIEPEYRSLGSGLWFFFGLGD